MNDWEMTSNVSQRLSHSGLLLMMYLLIKATSTPAPKGSNIDGIIKSNRKLYSVIAVIFVSSGSSKLNGVN